MKEKASKQHYVQTGMEGPYNSPLQQFLNAYWLIVHDTHMSTCTPSNQSHSTTHTHPFHTYIIITHTYNFHPPPAHPHTHTYPPTLPHTHTHTHTYTPTHLPSHTHTHTHTHIHTYIHTQVPIYPEEEEWLNPERIIGRELLEPNQRPAGKEAQNYVELRHTCRSLCVCVSVCFLITVCVVIVCLSRFFIACST